MLIRNINMKTIIIRKCLSKMTTPISRDDHDNLN